MLCKNCGKEIADDSRFCSNCGLPIEVLQQSLYVNNKKRNNKWRILWCILGGVFLFIVFIVMLCISLYLFEDSGSEYTKNEIYYDCTADSNGIVPQGSVQLLEGRTILVSVYVNCGGFWTSEKTNITQQYMGKAVDYITSCGKKYGKDVDLIYDNGENYGLRYFMKYDNALYDSENDNYEFDKVFNSWIEDNIPLDELKEYYGTDSIGYIIFLDSEGVSYTIAHFLEDKIRYFNEYSVIYIYEREKEYEVPAVYAHEILHLFGAVDLYKESNTDGVGKEFVKYVEKNYPNEIMYTTYEPDCSKNYKDITQQMSDITAYMVGFKDDIYELDKYPEIAKDCRGCFSRY